MNGKRFLRAAVTALFSASAGLFCCAAVFFLLWGDTAGAKLLPFLLFVPVFLAAAACLLIFRKRGRR